MTKSYRALEDYIVELFNNINKPIVWRGRSFNMVAACKPRPQRGGGECKTDVYVLVKNTENGTSDEIKISVKKDDAEFLANKLTASVAEDLLGFNWSSILIDSIRPIRHKFMPPTELVYLKTVKENTDAFFTLGWKLEVTDKHRNLSAKLNLHNDEIIKIIFKGENQPIEKKHSLTFGNVIEHNSGIAEYLLKGNQDKYPDAQSVIDDLIDLDTYNAGDIYLAFTANNYRITANKADGARTLVVAVRWTVENNRLSPEFIFDSPLIFQGERDMMPSIKLCLVELGIQSIADINIGEIKPN